jgi:hypothetical protein
MPRPILHGRDHEWGGADPARIAWESVGGAGSGGALLFNINNVGGWLSVEATGDSGAGRGMLLEADTGDIQISADTTKVEILSGTDITLFPGRDLIVSANRDVTVGGDRDVTIAANGGGLGGNIILTNLPTTDPGITGALWNSAGTLRIS